jgi:DENN (AEX-3) domain
MAWFGGYAPSAASAPPGNSAAEAGSSPAAQSLSPDSHPLRASFDVRAPDAAGGAVGAGGGPGAGGDAGQGDVGGKNPFHDSHHLHDGPADALLFTHFLCVGIGPGEPSRDGSPPEAKTPVAAGHNPGVSYDPELLFQWPEKEYTSGEMRLLNGIAGPKLGRFCFPEGVPCRAVRVGSTELRRIQGWPDGSTALELRDHDALANAPSDERREVHEDDILTPIDHPAATSVHVFRLFGDETGVMYGVCLVLDDLVDRRLSFSPTQDVPEADSKRRHQLAAPRCFFLLTHHPFFALHLSVLKAVAAEEAWAQRTGGSSREGVLRILKTYHTHSVPHEGQLLRQRVSVPRGNLEFKYNRPDGQSYEDLLSDWSLVTVFNSISLEHVLALFAALLTERQILVVHQDLSVVSALVLAVAPLFSPLAWQGLLIPVLPRNLQEMLNAPVPFVVVCFGSCCLLAFPCADFFDRFWWELQGVQKMPSPENVPPDVVVLDIGRNRIFVTAGGAGDGTGAMSYGGEDDESNVSTGAVPALPEAAKLRHNLRKEYANLRSLATARRKSAQPGGDLVGPNSFNTSPEERSAALRILDAWQKYLNWLVTKVTSFYEASKVDMTDMRARDRVNNDFVQGVTGNNRSFVRQFTSTQFLTEYVSRTFRKEQEHEQRTD